MDPLEYVINRMENAAKSEKPAEAGYGQARKELLDGIALLRFERNAAMALLRKWTLASDVGDDHKVYQATREFLIKHTKI